MNQANEFLKNINQYLPQLTFSVVLPVVLLFLKNGIDYLNITEIEKSILPLSKKIGVYLSQISIVSLVFTLMFFILCLFKYDQEDNGFVLIISLLIVYVIMFLASTVSFFLVFSFAYIWSIKIFFYVKEENTAGKWRILRRIDSTKLLLSKENKVFKFIEISEILNGREILSEMSERNKKENCIYKNTKFFKYFSITLFIFVPIMIIWGDILYKFNGAMRLFSMFFFILTSLFLLYVMTVESNKNIIERYEKASNKDVLFISTEEGHS